MNKAYLTIVVDSTTCEDLERELSESHIGTFKVLARGDITVADKDKDETALPNAVWLYEPEVHANSELLLVDFGGDTEGRVLTGEELDVLKQYGVCTEFKATHPDAAQYGSPLYTVHDDAAEAEASSYGFKVLADGFATNYVNGDDGSEARWLRIIMPAWFNPNL
ncbi:hypothetical protein WL29_22410 [Burkholderia ubonensis]|uniref:Uncharacterized protein n=1 Tax=Burkholderia ubonensis TaxID=101571 RepID=A0A125DME3_9BURK|nr:hypothetical protein [Burkholderia ubonensis]KWA84121.1 hypothetical protein WL29_22410 [Burkholderia ubonensis]